MLLRMTGSMPNGVAAPAHVEWWCTYVYGAREGCEGGRGREGEREDKDRLCWIPTIFALFPIRSCTRPAINDVRVKP